MMHRMAIAVLSLLGLLVSLYLWLWKMGWLGDLACGSGACETVQLSRFGEMLGVPVAFFGVGGYLGLLATSLVGIQPTWEKRRSPTLWLLAMSAVGLAFTAYLTILEAFVIQAWCRWCLVSAGLIAAIFALSIAGFARWPPSRPAPPGEPDG